MIQDEGNVANQSGTGVRNNRISISKNETIVFFLLLLYSVVLVVVNKTGGVDLKPSYLACRLMAQPELKSHLYAHDPVKFNLVEDPVWIDMASRSGIPTDAIPPFVQTPLWPYVLQPLCTTMSFSHFLLLFQAIQAICFCGLIWITGRYWAPGVFKPGWVLLISLLWLKADPIRDAFSLAQTHSIFLLLTLFGILQISRGRDFVGGMAVGIAALVKITPGALVLYWGVQKRYRAVLVTLAVVSALTALTLLAVGAPVMKDYIHNMSRVSNTLVPWDNNDSFASWWSALHGVSAKHFESFPISSGLKLFGLIAVILVTLAGGICDQVLNKRHPGVPPYGAIFAIVGATFFSPIAWSHYYILLVVPMMLALDYFLRSKSYLSLGFALAMVGFCSRLKFFAPEQHMVISLQHPVWGPFTAAVVAMASMLYLSWANYRKADPRTLSRSSEAAVPSEM